jgi:hypothetical protein
MLIRYGYELTFNCPQPAMMVCLLDAHCERSQELRYEIPPTTIPAIPTTTYLDTFGNTVRRFIAPPGDLTITSDAVIEDSGLPDPIGVQALRRLRSCSAAASTSSVQTRNVFNM